MPIGNSHYAKNINFGKAMNENINVVSDPQNPLTSCLFPSADNHFLHGSTTSRYTPHCRECENYMADRCAGVYKESETWDDKCMLYMNVNQDTIWPNQAAINSTASTVNVSRTANAPPAVLVPDPDIVNESYDNVLSIVCVPPV